MYRIRERKTNGRTQIIPIKFRTREEAQAFIDRQNTAMEKKPVPGVVRLEMASSKHAAYGWY